MKYDELRERLEIAKIRDDDRSLVLEILSHTPTPLQIEGIEAWLHGCEEWPEADFLLPDFVLDEMRFQNELDPTIRRLPPMFERKGIYHSEMVKHSPVRLMFTGEPRESKKKGEFYVNVTLENGNEHYLNLENDGVVATVRGLPKNQMFTVHAEGKGSSAYITVDEAPRLTPKTGGAPKGNANAAGVVPIREPISTLFTRALLQAKADIESFREAFDREPTEAELKVAMSYMIEHAKSGREIAA